MKTQGIIRFVCCCLIASVFASTPCFALDQEMPAPRKMPRAPVNRQALPATTKASELKSRDVTGTASIIDGDHLRINDIDLRLFGIVPPQLSASFGPQARSTLDNLAKGQNVTCHVRDRDHDGRFLATCTTENSKADLALELLKRGLAVTARGSIQPTELAQPYEAAEDAAQTAKLGLWSTASPPPAVTPAPTVTAAPTPAPAATPPVAADPVPPPVPAPAPAPKVEAKVDPSNIPPLPSELKKAEPPVVTNDKATVTISPSAPPLPAVASGAATAFTNSVVLPSASSTTPIPTSVEEGDAPGFFARYQLFITVIVVFGTALGIMAVLAAERRRDRRDEMKAIAAALRGELLAARAVCQARLKTWAESESKSSAWPRIRTTLYQAYVGRIGWLGAVLARQIASIYGQATDYATYFNTASGDGAKNEAVSKRQALQLLVQHIEEVLPRLATIEQTGIAPKGTGPASRPPGSTGVYILPAEPAPVHETHDYHDTSDEMPVYEAPTGHAAIVSPATPLWDAIKKLAHLHRPSSRRDNSTPAHDDQAPDYTTIIEEEMARMSSEEDSSMVQRNVSKMRTGA